MITIIDSGIANIASVVAACSRIGARTQVTTDGAAVREAEALILPGVGAFADGMASLSRYGLREPIREAVARGAPILGICLGMQLLADTGEEFGSHEGLGLIPGRTVRLEPAAPGERVPNIGWCDVVSSGARLFEGIPGGSAFYFVHSYHVLCASPSDVAATMTFGGKEAAVAVARENVFGVQFHPEKSQDVGLQLLDNFVRLAAA